MGYHNSGHNNVLDWLASFFLCVWGAHQWYPKLKTCTERKLDPCWRNEERIAFTFVSYHEPGLPVDLLFCRYLLHWGQQWSSFISVSMHPSGLKHNKRFSLQNSVPSALHSHKEQIPSFSPSGKRTNLSHFSPTFDGQWSWIAMGLFFR